MLYYIYYEWLHLWRNPFKVIAFLLFIVAASYGIQNGYHLYKERTQEIANIEQEIQQAQSEALRWMKNGEKGPEERPWVDITTPFWAMWYGNHYLFDEPSFLMNYSIGQSEYFGYYKRISMWSTAFDNDLTAELSNPEHTALGAFDFTFVWLYLLPLLLIVLCYSVQGLEYDLGFITLLQVQKSSRVRWIVQRLGAISFFIGALLVIFIFLPSLLLGTITGQIPSLILLFLYYLGYLLGWFMLLGYIIYHGKSQREQALKMAMVWLGLCVVIPGTVHQTAQLTHPGTLYLSFIDAQRDGSADIFDQPFEEVFAHLREEIPELTESYWALQDSVASQAAMNGIYRMSVNLYLDNIVDDIMARQEARNTFIETSYWINPVIAIHNRINAIAHTDYKSNLTYRKQIQEAGTQYNYRLLMDEWNQMSVDTTLFKEYGQIFDSLEPY